MPLGKACHTVGAAVLLAIATSLPHAAPAQESAPTVTTLRVQFTNLRNTKGVLRILLFDGSKNGKGFPGDPVAAKESRVLDLAKEAKPGSKDIITTFADLPSGTYAVAVLHDENNNNKMDTHWYGKPKEGSAASNNPRPKTRAPRWNEAKFEMTTSGKAIDVALWYP